MTRPDTIQESELPSDPTTNLFRGIGASRIRPDAHEKAAGQYAFSSDLHAENMLWGATLRSTRAHATIARLDTSRVAEVQGVRAIITAADIPGQNSFGLMIKDQPVLAADVVRFYGEPIAVVAATTMAAAMEAVRAIDVTYDDLPVAADPVAVFTAGDPDAFVRDVRVRRGTIPTESDLTVEHSYEMGMQDQAALGTESGLALYSANDEIDLYVNTQWTHADRNQLATIMDMAPASVRVHTAGIGGAFGSREDITLQAHLCLLARATGSAVKMQYTREESFLGHVHRHPAWMTYRHRADRSGRLVSVEATMILDGGAYASTSPAVGGNAALFAVGPYDCPNVDIRTVVVYTNNPPTGAMRGFGAVQPAFAYETQMNELASLAGISPINVRLVNALRDGSTMPTGQKLLGQVPVTQMLRELERLPAPPELPQQPSGSVPGDPGEDLAYANMRRGVGYAIGLKAGGIPEGERDYTVARVRLYVDNDELTADVESAGAEVGQGLVTVEEQIVASELGVARVNLIPTDTSRIGSAGSSSASRATYMTAGAMQAACHAILERVTEKAYDKFGHRNPAIFDEQADIMAKDGYLCDRDGNQIISIVDVLGTESVEETHRYNHRLTTPIDANGQGDPHIQFIFCAHRVVADVDVDTGLIRIVDVTAVEDVGRAMNPMAIEGQMQGGTVQGIGLALMEEVLTQDGIVRNPSFTDYLIPTCADVPDVKTVILEMPDPDAPYGLKGVGEPSIISSPPAVAAAVSDAVGQTVLRVPIHPDDIVFAVHDVDRAS